MTTDQTTTEQDATQYHRSPRTLQVQQRDIQLAITALERAGLDKARLAEMYGMDDQQSDAYALLRLAALLRGVDQAGDCITVGEKGGTYFYA